MPRAASSGAPRTLMPSAPDAVVPVVAEALGDAADPDPDPVPVPAVPELTSAITLPDPKVLVIIGVNVLVDVVLEVEPVPVVVLVAASVALAAVWNAVKDLSAVGLTAKTMPLPQWATGLQSSTSGRHGHPKAGIRTSSGHSRTRAGSCH
jgi:hypothetical protein